MGQKRSAFNAGVQGIIYPVEWGGTRPDDFDAFHELVLWDELARLGGGGVLGQMAINSMALPPVMHFGPPAMRERVCRAVITGKKNISLAISEPTAGSDEEPSRCAPPVAAKPSASARARLRLLQHSGSGSSVDGPDEQDDIQGGGAGERREVVEAPQPDDGATTSSSSTSAETLRARGVALTRPPPSYTAVDRAQRLVLRRDGRPFSTSSRESTI